MRAGPIHCLANRDEGLSGFNFICCSYVRPQEVTFEADPALEVPLVYISTDVILFSAVTLKARAEEIEHYSKLETQSMVSLYGLYVIITMICMCFSTKNHVKRVLTIR